MTKANKPKEIWGTAVNLSGLWDKEPLKMSLCKTVGVWYDADGHVSIEKLGLVKRNGIVTFGSENKHEVELFIAGARAAFSMVSKVAWTESK